MSNLAAFYGTDYRRARTIAGCTHYFKNKILGPKALEKAKNLFPSCPNIFLLIGMLEAWEEHQLKEMLDRVDYYAK